MSTIRLRDAAKRDGRLYVPRQAAPQRPLPLIVLLHGGGGRAEDFQSMFPLAEEFGVVMLALDSRHNTWDGIDSPFGPDVQFIDAALRYTFERVAVNPERVALGGLSDGGAYALSLGLSRNFADDHEMLKHGLVMYDALYAWCRECQGETHNWPPKMN
jgi:poly(3-hydroxybutyrate) depolymerase